MIVLGCAGQTEEPLQVALENEGVVKFLFGVDVGQAEFEWIEACIRFISLLEGSLQRSGASHQGRPDLLRSTR